MTEPSSTPMPFLLPFDDEHARMMAYARSPEGRGKIEQAQAEIDAGQGIVADQAYFDDELTRRISARRAGRTPKA